MMPPSSWSWTPISSAWTKLLLLISSSSLQHGEATAACCCCCRQRWREQSLQTACKRALWLWRKAEGEEMKHALRSRSAIKEPAAASCSPSRSCRRYASCFHDGCASQVTCGNSSGSIARSSFVLVFHELDHV